MIVPVNLPDHLAQARSEASKFCEATADADDEAKADADDLHTGSDDLHTGSSAKLSQVCVLGAIARVW